MMTRSQISIYAAEAKRISRQLAATRTHKEQAPLVHAWAAATIQALKESQMARIRTIKPEFFTSDDIVSMSPLARIFYIALWCEADREGRLEWKPRTHKLRYLPGDDCDIDDLSAELIEAGLVVLYSVDGKQYAEIPSFLKHQVINNRETGSKIPPRDIDASTTREARVNDASGTRAHASVGEGKGKEGIYISGEPDVHNPSRFEEFWKAYPSTGRKVAKATCAKRWTARQLDQLADKIIAHVTAVRETKQWREGYEPAPLTYLNQSRWEDGLPEQAADPTAENMFEGAI